jgi:type II secretory pathway pseudopilin PulG
MATGKAHRSAFTLVELMVVVAILMLLVTFLIPYLTRARGIARRALCLSNMRNLAQAGTGFATAHGGRGPGGAERYRFDTGKGDSSICWVEILNTEYYRGDTIMRGMWWPKIDKNKLVCPDATLWHGRWYTCPYQWNLDAAGGPATGSDPPEGPYGLAVIPSRMNYLYFAGSGSYYLGQYSLGALLENFKRPTYAFMLIESEHANDTIGWLGTDPTRVNPMINAGTNPGVTGSLPPWAAGTTSPDDFYGFRHVLPPDTLLYQAQATACAAYMDGHVAIVTPNMDLNLVEHYQIKPGTP